jgi:hypothetical protein
MRIVEAIDQFGNIRRLQAGQLLAHLIVLASFEQRVDVWA